MKWLNYIRAASLYNLLVGCDSNHSNQVTYSGIVISKCRFLFVMNTAYHIAMQLSTRIMNYNFSFITFRELTISVFYISHFMNCVLYIYGL